MVVRDKYGGYWHKTRSMVDSGGLSVSCMISTIKIFHNIRQKSPFFIPPHVFLTILAPTRCQHQARVFPRQRLFRIPSGRHARYKRVNSVPSILIPTARNHHALVNMLTSSHEITNISKNISVLSSSQNNTQPY